MDETQQRLAEELLFTEKKKKSFAKQLFQGIFDSTDVLPFPVLESGKQAEATAFEEKVEAFADAHIDADAIDRGADIPRSVIDGLAKLGVLGMTVPQRYSGLNMSQKAYCRIAELMARRCASTALFINAHQSIGLKSLLLFGSDAQKERWLPRLARGELIAAFSLTEPNAGSDASGVETLATWDDEKQVWRLNGKKQWTTNASIADVLTIMAKTSVTTPRGKEEKVTAFLVTPDMAGFQITAAALEKTGMRGTRTGNITLTDVCVPADQVLGPVGGGLRVCLTVLDYGRTTFGATCTGAAKKLVDDAFDRAINRYQFKRPLASFALVKKKLSTMAALAYAMEATTYMTAGLIDSGVEDFMLEAALLKVFCSESLWYIVYETMQIFGGKSFFTDVPYERMMRDARLNMIGEGANEVLRAFIGLVGMRDTGMELKALLEAWRRWPFPIKQSFQRISKHLFSPHIAISAAPLQPAVKQLRKAIRRFGVAVVRVLARYREEVVEKQLALDRLSTSAIALYSSTAVLSRLALTLQQNNNDAAQCRKELTSGLFYCRIAMNQLDDALNGLFSPLDSATVEAADELLR